MGAAGAGERLQGKLREAAELELGREAWSRVRAIRRGSRFWESHQDTLGELHAAGNGVGELEAGEKLLGKRFQVPGGLGESLGCRERLWVPERGCREAAEQR